MFKNLLLGCLLLFSLDAYAYAPPPNCPSNGSNALTYTTSNNNFACSTITGAGSSFVNLGTSSSQTSPRVTGDATTGFASLGTALIDASIAGVKTVEIGTGELSLFGGTVTTSIPALNITQTWNNSGVTFDAPLFENITNTASAGGYLIDLQVGSSSKFNADTNGNVNAYNYTCNRPNCQALFVNSNDNQGLIFGESYNVGKIGFWNGGSIQMLLALAPSGLVATTQDPFVYPPGYRNVLDDGSANAYMGIGTNKPSNKLDVSGGTAIGSSYVGVTTAPTNGLIVQGVVGIGTATPNTGVALDVGSYTTSMLLPLGTTGQRPTGIEGMLRYNNTTHNPEYYSNTAWTAVGASSMIYPGAGIANSTGSAWGTSYTTSGSGTVVALTNAPAFTGTVTGTSVSWTAPTTSTVNTAISQGAAGFFLAFATNAGLSAGEIITGTSIPANTTLNYVTSGTAVKSTTASGAGSGFNVTVASATTIVPGMLVTDTTTPAHIANQCVVTFVASTVISLSCSTASIANADGLNFYPTVKLSNITSGTVGSGVTMTFTTNAANDTVTALNSAGDLTIGGNINQGANRIIAVTASTANGDPSATVPLFSSAAFGIGSLAAASAEGGNTAIGAYSLNAMTGQQGIYEQSSFALLGNASFNTAVGLGSMYYATPSSPTATSGSGSFNTAIGAFSLLRITNGNRNTSLGEASGQGITTGNFNTLVGSENMNLSGSGGAASQNVSVGADIMQNITGSGNVAAGYNALDAGTATSYNTCIGFDSCIKMTGAGSTDYNVSLGAYALGGSGTPANNTGVNNTAIGTGALDGVTSGSNNTVMGFEVGQTTTSGSNNILIGVNTAVNASSATASNEIHIGGTGGDAINITGTGTTSTEAVTINGSITLPAVTTGTNTDFVCMSTGNKLTLQTSACTISQRKLKEHIKFLDADRALDDIMSLKPVTFNMRPMKTPNSDPNYTHQQYGFIAEDVAAVDERLAVYEDDMKTPKTYRQEAIIADLVKVVQMQQVQIDKLNQDSPQQRNEGHRCYVLFWCANKL